MKLKALMAITGLTLFALIASAPSFARTKAEIDASADKALSDFYTLNPKHKELVNKAAGILIFGRVLVRLWQAARRGGAEPALPHHTGTRLLRPQNGNHVHQVRRADPARLQIHPRP